MNLKNQPPIFVPREHLAEFDRLSKAALMDIVWDYATRCAHDEDEAKIMAEFRATAVTINTHRKQAKRDRPRDDGTAVDPDGEPGQ